MKQYAHPLRVLLALDCIIFGFDGEEIKLLLIKRNFEPELGKWSLMGGFLNNNEDLEDAARRILYQLTGLKDVYMEQLQTFGKIDRDPVERTVSVAYFSLIKITNQISEASQAVNGTWISLNNIPELIFDHNYMVDLAIERLRFKAAIHPVGFELLPEKFTIPQLQKLYELIYNTSIDRRNFSRKILSTGLLVTTGEKDQKATTKKGALYKLDKEKYIKYLNTINNFFSDSLTT